jgi:hypothetical protein
LVAKADGPLTLQQAGTHLVTQGSGTAREWAVGGSVDLSVLDVAKLLGLGELTGSYGESITVDASQEKNLDFAVPQDYYAYAAIIIGYVRKFVYFRHFTPAGEHRLNTDYSHRVWKDTRSVARLHWCGPIHKDVPYPTYNPATEPPLPPNPDEN